MRDYLAIQREIDKLGLDARVSKTGKHGPHWVVVIVRGIDVIADAFNRVSSRHDDIAAAIRAVEPEAWPLVEYHGPRTKPESQLTLF